MYDFQLSAKGTTVKNEFIGSLTNFSTTVYVLFVHPSILSETGKEKGALITITCLLVFASTRLVGLWPWLREWV